jgi:hypothetical protein
MRGHANILRAAAKRDPDPAAERFLINLAVCNTVVPAISDDGHFVYQVGGAACMFCVATRPDLI